MRKLITFQNQDIPKLKSFNYFFSSEGLSRKLFSFGYQKKKKKSNIAHCSNATGSKIILIIKAKRSWYLPFHTIYTLSKVSTKI